MLPRERDENIYTESGGSAAMHTLFTGGGKRAIATDHGHLVNYSKGAMPSYFGDISALFSARLHECGLRQTRALL